MCNSCNNNVTTTNGCSTCHSKESKNSWVRAVKPIIKQYINTNWKKSDSYTVGGCYFHIQSSDDYFLITSLVNYKNGNLNIKRHVVNPHEIDEFLGLAVQRNDNIQEYDEDRDRYDCPQLEQTHYYEQHNPLKKITKKAFEKQVQKYILDELHLGLKFE